MARGKSKGADVYQIITDSITAKLEQGIVPWRGALSLCGRLARGEG